MYMCVCVCVCVCLVMFRHTSRQTDTHSTSQLRWELAAVMCLPVCVSLCLYMCTCLYLFVCDLCVSRHYRVERPSSRVLPAMSSEHLVQQWPSLAQQWHSQLLANRPLWLRLLDQLEPRQPRSWLQCRREWVAHQGLNTLSWLQELGLQAALQPLYQAHQLQDVLSVCTTSTVPHYRYW